MRPRVLGNFSQGASLSATSTYDPVPGSASGGLRKRRRNPFVQVPSSAVNDSTLSYRALGVLVYLLDKPDGWVVSAERLAKNPTRGGREGRDAVRSALRELALAGYYRLERRQRRDGTFSMGTALSEDRVDAWAQQAEHFEGRAVTVVEQTDGSWMVRYADGTMQPDDFPPPEVSAGQTEDGFSGPGAETDLQPGPGNPASGFPASGFPPPLTEDQPDAQTDDQSGGTLPPDPLRPPSPSARGNDEINSLSDAPTAAQDHQSESLPREGKSGIPDTRLENGRFGHVPQQVDQAPRPLCADHPSSRQHAAA